MYTKGCQAVAPLGPLQLGLPRRVPESTPTSSDSRRWGTSPETVRTRVSSSFRKGWKGEARGERDFRVAGKRSLRHLTFPYEGGLPKTDVEEKLTKWKGASRAVRSQDPYIFKYSYCTFTRRNTETLH